MDSQRVSVVRAAYECFNNEDIAGVLDLCDPGIELPDVLHGSVIRGRAAVEQYWRRQFEVVDHSVVLGDVVETGDNVVVVAYHQIYEPDGGPLGPGVAAVHRLTFRVDLIAKIEFMGLDDVPQPVRERLG